MAGRGQPIYVQRRSYRMRRLIDACRVLPFVGALLWLIPLLWGQGEGGVAGSRAVIYMFAVWLILIVAGVILSARLPAEALIDEGADPAEDTP